MSDKNPPRLYNQLQFREEQLSKEQNTVTPAVSLPEQPSTPETVQEQAQSTAVDAHTVPVPARSQVSEPELDPQITQQYPRRYENGLRDPMPPDNTWLGVDLTGFSPAEEESMLGKILDDTPMTARECAWLGWSLHLRQPAGKLELEQDVPFE